MRIAAIALVACAFIAGPASAPTNAAGKAKPITVAKDAAGDWSGVGAPGEGAAGDALGQDLVEGQIGMADAKTVDFIIKVNSLPPAGGMPEFTRYTWEMLVGSKQLQLDGKFTNYTRGICDPTAGTCPPPRDPGPQPFFVRTNCSGGTGATVCEEVGIVQATFDASSGTITIPVPLKLLGAGSGTKISGASFLFGGISAMPSAFASAAGGPNDQMIQNKEFVIP